MIARNFAGDLSGEETAEEFAVRMHAIFDGKEPALLDAYSVLVAELLGTIAQLSSREQAIEIARGLTAAVIEGDHDMSAVDKGRSRKDVQRDIRLAVLGTTRLLLEDAPDDDLALIQRFNAESMLPEAINFLCWALLDAGSPTETLDFYTQRVLHESLAGGAK
jgi:hypothetical protein